MKKLSLILLAFALVLSMTACGGNSNNSESHTQSTPSSQTEEPPANQAPLESDPVSQDDLASDGESASEEALASDTEDEPTGSNILVAYFSRVGNTEWEDGVDAVSSVSLNLADGEYIGNAQHLAQMAQEATGGDLSLIQTVETYPSGYQETTNVVAAQQNNKEHPALASHVENMGQYDTVVLVYPIWWGTLPPPLETFLEEYDFSGKTILPICTHGGSGMSGTENDISELAPGATVLDGLAVNSSNVLSAQDSVVDYISKSDVLG